MTDAIMRIVFDWIRDDAPTGIKLMLGPVTVGKLVDRLKHEMAMQYIADFGQYQDWIEEKARLTAELARKDADWEGDYPQAPTERLI